MEMRRKDRLVDDPDELRLILEECKVWPIATMDEEGLYIVPLNFGYEYDGGKLAPMTSIPPAMAAKSGLSETMRPWRLKWIPAINSWRATPPARPATAT